MQLDDSSILVHLPLLFHTIKQMQMKTSSLAAPAPASVRFDTHKAKINILKYNTDNTNINTLDGEILHQLETFTYLASVICQHGRFHANVKAWITKVSTAFLQLNNIWNSKQLSISQHQCHNLQYERQHSSTVLN
ncbi:unnamed protein product [Schistosoma margrebowiei]|uniref:Uncharacterized protein n=1 Tax=Schistosoma margrebowiei TaxID=48269 RepID=A0A183MW93_9TREM|nr:unnamed protein product [Schistosoma margrebowiei]